MTVFSKIFTAIRGGISEAGNAVVEANALRILDQELLDASEELKVSKNNLAELIARKKLAEEKTREHKADIKLHEGYAKKALTLGDEPLARDVAIKINDLEAECLNQETLATGYKTSVEQLELAVKTAERDIQHLKQQISTVKATESVQRAQAAVSERFSGSHSKLRTATDSLERIKERQALQAKRMEAAVEINDTRSNASLEQRLQQAGITPAPDGADAVLERIKNS